MPLQASAPFIDKRKTHKLEEVFGGEIVLPTDEHYHRSRAVWNGSIDRRPSVIAHCTGVSDVLNAVRFAREHELPIAVRAGGHSFPGHSVCDEGMLVDLRRMRGIRVDPAGRTVRAQAGVLLGELDRETQEFGMAVPAGIVSHTGLAGLTLGGGIGWVMRKYGLTIDNLVSADVVTPDGKFVKASKDENPDLFWGIRGGGGNFGIVTDFEFGLQATGTRIYGGPILWPMKDQTKLLRFYRDWISGCPDELMTIVTQRRIPEIPGVPADLVGRLSVGIVACYVGPEKEAERALGPLKNFGRPILDLCGPTTYLEHQAMFDPSFPHGCWYYVRSCDVDELNDEILQVMEKFGEKIVSPMTSIALWQMGGEVSRVDESGTAFNGRHAGFSFNINGNSETEEGFERERDWARSYWAALAPFHTSVYVNFLMEEGEERIRSAYGARKYDLLKRLKQKYDPTNVLRFNQNIRPD